MRSFLINKAMDSIKEKENYDKTKLAEIKYGLETLYITITKTIVILTAAYFLGILKELLLILLFYGALRTTGFGLHTKKSWQCWISSLIIFLLFPYLIKVMHLDVITRIIISSLSTIYILIYAPADTEKRPLIRKNKRLIYKIICTSTALGISIYQFYTKDIILQNAIIVSLIIEIMMISPFTYKIFKLKYANYKSYDLKKAVST